MLTSFVKIWGLEVFIMKEIKIIQSFIIITLTLYPLNATDLKLKPCSGTERRKGHTGTSFRRFCRLALRLDHRRRVAEVPGDDFQIGCEPRSRRR